MAMADLDRTAGSGDPEHILDGFISEAEYARQRGVSVRTCQRDRQLRQAPPFVIVGRRVFYRVDGVREWLKSRERQVVRRAEAPRAGRRRHA